MGKPTKRQSRKTYNYDKDRRKAWRKKKKMPAIKCKEIKESWDPKMSLYGNLREMGLSSDPNQTFKIKKTKELITPMDVGESSKQEKSKAPTKLHVTQALEAEASIPAEKTNKLSEPDVLFCTYMLDKYGDDYKAMARDPRNHYQDTPKQIKKKINHFKNSSKQYEVYLKSKVHDIYEPWRLNCCSPEPTELQGLPSYDIRQRRRLRRVTRKYEAARRNGHYAISPAINDGETTLKTPVCLSRVRRKLNFGRKPPRNRSTCNNENDSAAVGTEDTMKHSCLGKKALCKCFAGELRHISDTDCTKDSDFMSLSIRNRTRRT